MKNKREILKLGAYSLGILVLMKIFVNTGGVWSYLDAWACLVIFILLIKEFFSFFGILGKAVTARSFYRIMLLVSAVFLILTVFEGFLWVEQNVLGRAGGHALVMPKEWKRRQAHVQGAREASYYHGKLHVINDIGMRRAEPFGPKREGVFRIMVVGDSMTWGPGVGEEETYPRLMEAELSETHRVEVLNLAICGYQSENILWVIKTFTPQLDPDLVVYGVCLNDFLPSRVGQYETDMAYPFPLPMAFKKYMAEHTLSGKLFADRYNSVLLDLGVRHDFISDILRGIEGYKIKFGRDVMAMNKFVMDRGLPPMVSMVVHQRPKTGEKTQELAKTGERYMKIAGMIVAPSQYYFSKYDGQLWYVSAWEPHPNQFAHRVYAKEFIKALIKLPELAPYKKNEASEGPDVKHDR